MGWSAYGYQRVLFGAALSGLEARGWAGSGHAFFPEGVGEGRSTGTAIHLSVTGSLSGCSRGLSGSNHAGFVFVTSARRAFLLTGRKASCACQQPLAVFVSVF